MKGIPEILKPFEEFLKSTEKPAVSITFEKGKTLPWESKCGGCPYLESVEDYPRDTEGKPMMFLAQINFDDMPHLDGYPESGLMQFFIGDDDYLGLDSGCKVIYLPEYTKDASKLLAENPFEQDYLERAPYRREGRMKFTPNTMPIGTECAAFGDKFYKKVTDEEWDALYDVCYPQGCFVGGYPLFVQNSPEYYDSGEFDVVLLQLDCEDECGIMFGDAGSCVFLISKDDLEKRCFDNVQYEWQCC